MSFVVRTIDVREFQIVRDGAALLATPLCASFGTGLLNVVTGANGSGKTTLLDTLALRTAAKGNCVMSHSHHLKPQDIAYLPQSPVHIFDIKINHLVDLAFRNRLAPPAIPAQLTDVLRQRDREVGELSGGQRQMLLFWLVALQQRQIYIYDEPLRHLDDRATEYVVATVKQQIIDDKLVILSDHSDIERWRAGVQRIRLSPPGQSS